MITEEQITEVPLTINQGMLRCIDETGDTKIIWDRTKPDEIAAAKAVFNSLKDKHYMAYSVTGKDGGKGEVITTFDPHAERLIMAPRMVGG